MADAEQRTDPVDLLLPADAVELLLPDELEGGLEAVDARRVRAQADLEALELGGQRVQGRLVHQALAHGEVALQLLRQPPHAAELPDQLLGRGR